ncbi:glycosyltransferase family 4 protein [Methanooceanicella nereidis]|uniref:glycosyltransferase family 4 protein n=1 Tax=Methanooceanicella nereidis TaxID=2052831 RepID=UPI001E321B26|nr:glycosyltransferase family 4 protein [Methanocella sp. CWC-04]
MKIVSIGNFIDYQIQLSNNLVKNDSTMLVLYTMGKTIPEEHFGIVGEGVDINVLSRSGPIYDPIKLSRFLFDFYRVMRKIRKYEPDVIHFQIGSPILAFFVPFLKRYRMVTTFHDVKPHTGEKKFWEPMPLHYLLRSSEEILVHGEKLKQIIVDAQYKPSDKVHSIPMGPHNIEPFMVHLNDDIKEEDNTILFFGRIYEYKGLEYLIKAEPLITKEIPDARIVIAGTGEDFKKYEDMMVNRDRFIVYNHHISFKEGAEIFQRCSVVALPYIDASQSGVVSTAYGFKKPVVVTDVGALSEIVDDGITGLVIQPGNPEALAAAIIKLLKDRGLRKRMGENAYKKLNTDLSWENISKRTIDIYKKATDGSFHN